MTAKQKQIVATWDAIESYEPDISTEQLFARVSAIHHCDDADVADALWEEKKLTASESARPGSHRPPPETQP